MLIRNTFKNIFLSLIIEQKLVDQRILKLKIVISKVQYSFTIFVSKACFKKPISIMNIKIGSEIDCFYDLLKKKHMLDC